MAARPGSGRLPAGGEPPTAGGLRGAEEDVSLAQKLSTVCRFRLFVFLTLSSAAALYGQSGSDRVLCSSGFIDIVSPDAREITQARCKAVAAQAMAAWRFDANTMRWSNPGGLETKRLTFRLLSVPRMKQEHAGLYGFSKGRNLFVASLAVLDQPFAQGTLAHEIAHIQAARAMGTDAWGSLVPRYFVEGHGNALGRAYRDHLRIAVHSYDIQMARKIVSMSPDQARLLYLDRAYASARDQQDNVESTGIFLVEYLRGRCRQQGAGDVIPRISRVFERIGRGESYESGFQREFGTSVEQAISGIIDFMKRTESAPAERLRGTLYEEFAVTRR